MTGGAEVDTEDAGIVVFPGWVVTTEVDGDVVVRGGTIDVVGEHAARKTIAMKRTMLGSRENLIGQV